ncbi:AAA family ATPase [Ornithinimicrobium sp. INDO-MA30-4]|uniref:AAA family ATPase n=1 Tax=Ornithinimicrobium sp. INDO-MA30-4 TaxID=2908651 RepID=UPI001F3E6613|nr:AAA family ATPase [Ornithinimicrobium sp. INDO-MA30-4]UJH71012.1 AAA family ATPase [Ornithinimicrobium sp. INDO-MA30-4]
MKAHRWLTQDDPAVITHLRAAISPHLSLGRPVLVGIDGRSGTGKTTLARDLRRELSCAPGSTRVIHMDGLYPGWQGLAASVEIVRRDILAPLHRGESATYRLWDWHHDKPGLLTTVKPQQVIIVEGVGSITASPDDYDLRVWIEAPENVRRRRALARDGAMFEPHWDRWAAQEATYFATNTWAVPAHFGIHGADDE